MGRSVAQPITANELALALGATVFGDGSMQITSVSSLQFATPGDLTFFSDHKHQSAAIKSAASVMIVREADASLITCTRIVDATPHAAFARALDLLFPAQPHVVSISSMAQLSALAQVAGARVDAFSSVGARSVIGAGSVIHSHVFIGDDVRIGEHCVIYPGASIMSGVQLGDRCIIHPGAVIGSDGFGFQPSAVGWQKVAQVGSVIVGSDVEIGANTTVDRGAIEDTVIGSGVKIDNLVQIAHNVKIGEHTAIAACAGIAGSTKVGARCMIGGAAMIVGHISICDDVIVSGGTLITNSIEQPGRYTGVFPSAEHREWAKIAATIRRSTKSRTK